MIKTLKRFFKYIINKIKLLMALSFNGNTIDTSNGTVTYNGSELDKLQLNGVTVWEKEIYTNTPYLSYGSQSSTGNYNNRGFVSSDLVNWTWDGVSSSSSSSTTSTGSSYLNIARSHSYTNGMHIAIDTATSDHIIYTKGGISWNSLSMPTTMYASNGTKLLYNGLFYIIWNAYKAFYTPNLTQTPAQISFSNSVTKDCITTVNGKFFFGDTSEQKVYMSEDCVNWIPIQYSNYTNNNGETIYPISPSNIFIIPSAYYNGFYYGIRSVSSGSSSSTTLTKWNSDFSIQYNMSSSRYFSGNFYQLNTKLFCISYTSNHATNYISYLNPENDSIVDILNCGGYYPGDEFDLYDSSHNYVYNGNGSIINITENGYQTITNPSGYYLKKIAYFGKTQ